MRSLCILFVLTFGTFLFGQAQEKPRFLAADVHGTAKGQTQRIQPPVGRGELFESRNFPITELIAFAYNTTAPKVVGGPSWVEMERFDILAKQPPQTPIEQQRLMLQALLAERFKLVVREETQPFVSFALTSSGKHKMKEADGTGTTGCAPQASTAPAGPGVLRLSLASVEGAAPVQISITDGMVEYKCRNMTMAAFASGMRSMLVPNLGVNPILDQTGIAGTWTVDLKYSIGLIGLPGSSGEQTTIFEAIDKQMGLKLEEKQTPTQLVVIASVNREPSANPAGTAEALPRIVIPKEFEVASVKLTNPDQKRSMFQTPAGGRVNAEGIPLSFLINRAFNPSYSGQLVGVPDSVNAVRIDMQAQAAAEVTQNLDPDTLAPMMLALLKERFGLKYHVEQREVQAYDLVAAKPKMKKADPAARSWCKAPAQVPGSAPAPQGSQGLICQNVTMAQFAELLRGRTPELTTGVADATGLDGSWDFRFTFNPVIALAAARAAVEGAAGATPAPLSAASDPAMGVSIFDALDKQLGLKLEKVKRMAAVTVIDRIDLVPSDN